MDKILKKQFKKEINKQVRMISWYQLSLFLAIFIYGIFNIIHLGINIGSTDDITDPILELLMSSGLPMILGSVFGIIIIVIYRKKSFLRYDLVVKNKKMNLNVLFKIMLCFLFAQAIFFVSSIGVEKLLNYFGYTIMRDIETASSVSTTLSMFLYASIIGPIAEEFLFRGALLRELEKHGKLFAIIVSSVLFGVFHSNILQGLFATIVGLILGYVTIEYSIKWAIILHIINNFIFGDVLGFILSYFSPNYQEIFNIIILVPSLLGGLLVLFKSRNGIKNYIKINKSKEKLYRFTFSSAWIIFYIIVNLLIAISGIVKII